MSVFAISDLHLSLTCDKPMDVFGGPWENYVEEIFASWKENVGENDIVLLCGDLSWAMKLEDALKDIDFLSELPGKKVIIRGNHDYWWDSISKLRSKLPKNFYAVQNDAVKIDNYIFFGTRGWTVQEKKQLNEEDKKIYDREVIRLGMAADSMKKQFEDGDIPICIMHYPPLNSKKDSNEFSEIIENSGAKKVVYGHLHGKDLNREKIFVKNGVEYFLTSCDQVNNQPVKIF